MPLIVRSGGRNLIFNCVAIVQILPCLLHGLCSNFDRVKLQEVHRLLGGGRGNAGARAPHGGLYYKDIDRSMYRAI
jgi:hypothetical protein